MPDPVTPETPPEVQLVQPAMEKVESIIYTADFYPCDFVDNVVGMLVPDIRQKYLQNPTFTIDAAFADEVLKNLKVELPPCFESFFVGLRLEPQIGAVLHMPNGENPQLSFILRFVGSGTDLNILKTRISEQYDEFYKDADIGIVFSLGSPSQTK